MESGDFLIYIGGLCFAILLYYFITRWAHAVEKRVKYMEAQIKLLGKIAEKQGVSKDEIEGIYNEAVR